MSDQNQPEQQSGYSLGGLSAGEYDTQLTSPEQMLQVPRDALLAYRISGGLRFRSRRLCIFRDGWVLVDDDEAGGARLRHLSPAALARLRHLALRARLALPRPGTAGQPPDGYAYEIAFRRGKQVRHMELMSGSIPAEVAPLLRALRRLW